ncbi:conserved hypothetical protein [Ricinus communis]|uniref:Uncharacterized protein n=1 Tax=Ricinus communis TaxID=3988 RepID=B9S3N4_RICCO|nr:conserved hypothetical protein [Ricinus communis]
MASLAFIHPLGQHPRLRKFGKCCGVTFVMLLVWDFDAVMNKRENCGAIGVVAHDSSSSLLFTQVA